MSKFTREININRNNFLLSFFLDSKTDVVEVNGWKLRKFFSRRRQVWWVEVLNKKI